MEKPSGIPALCQKLSLSLWWKCLASRNLLTWAADWGAPLCLCVLSIISPAWQRSLNVTFKLLKQSRSQSLMAFPSGCKSGPGFHVSGVSVKTLLSFIGHPWEQSCTGQPVHWRHDSGYRRRVHGAHDSSGSSEQNQGVHRWDGAVRRQVGCSQAYTWAAHPRPRCSGSGVIGGRVSFVSWNLSFGFCGWAVL